jgi:hypothetical protein
MKYVKKGPNKKIRGKRKQEKQDGGTETTTEKLMDRKQVTKKSK